MFFIIAFIVLIGLMVAHEFGHFIIAKKFGVKVEEFGIGYPPRLFGKKFGETLYSVNLIPFGAFVKIPGEIKKTDDPFSFSNQPIVKRMLIVAGGVISFWIIAAILFSVVFVMGARIAVDDTSSAVLNDPKVQIAMVVPGSPAKNAGLQLGDVIQKISAGDETFEITEVSKVQEISRVYKGKEIALTIERGKEIKNVFLTPRVSSPAGEGPIGIALVRTALKSYAPHEAFVEGLKTTGQMTIGVVQGWYFAIQRLTAGEPTGAELVGPVGIFNMMAQFGKLGLSYFLQFIAMISIYLALFNILPIPATDGGKLVFLAIEALRKKPLSEKIEESVTTVSFLLLIVMAILVTIKDVMKLF